jgi:Flp pilus assembly protein TadG
MIPVALKRTAHRLTLKSLGAARAAACTFRDKTDGIAAVEFALILPILTIMMIGAIEMGDAVTVDRRVSMVASTAGDLLARYDGSNVTEAQVADIGQVAGWLMDPYATAGTKICVPARIPGPGSGTCGRACRQRSEHSQGLVLRLSRRQRQLGRLHLSGHPRGWRLLHHA